ncbi:DUF5632 domain-containing protein [Mycobacterium shinjukuense]|nr:DUF5632 domain-containing protein [Mycobacterium shinjukuense]
MAADLPPGRWTAALVGPWWPAPPAALRAAAQHWATWAMQKQELARKLINQHDLLSRNQGRTAEDLIGRYLRGAKSEVTKAEKYEIKKGAFNTAADAIDYLRSRLTEIAGEGNKEIDDVLASKKPLPEQLAEIQAIQARCNADAANASRDAVDNVMTATQEILEAEDIGDDPRTWARANGLNVDDAPPPSPIGKDALDVAPPLGRGTGGPGTGDCGPVEGGDRSAPALGAGTGGPGSGGNQIGTQVNALPPRAIGATGGPLSAGPVPTGPPVTTPAAATPPVIATGPPVAMPGGSLSPAALGQGVSPTSIGQSFATGMVTGQPAAAGAHSLSEGATTAMQSGSVPPPQAAPAITTPPVVSAPTMAAGLEATHGPVDTPANTPGGSPASTGNSGPVAPTVVTAGPVAAPAAPVVGGSAVPAGPLPAYGSDLRPPVVAAPAMPTVPTAPVSGAPVAPSASSAPSAGGALVSPVERAASKAVAGQAGASSSTMAGASALSATAGATAGAASARAAEQQRLQRIVDAVARQEPRISWAAGLRDDGTTTLLVTDLAGGWIPPHVRLPANVTLLEPTARRRDAGVVDLLGAVVAVAAHEPNTYVAEAGPDAPALTGDRSARSAIPMVDEFGPTLVEAVRRRDSLPRIAQAIALPAVRKTGVLENEAELLHGCITAVKESVLKAYPGHELTAVGDWMLLAAIEALIDDHEYLANYHLAWFAVTTRRGGS